MLIYPDDMALIRSHPSFAHFKSDADIKWFLQCMDAKIQTEPAGTLLCAQGEKQEFVPIVLQGETDAAVPPFARWQRIQSESGLAPSVIALVPPATVRTSGACRILWLRVMRLFRICNRHCDFHESFDLGSS